MTIKCDHSLESGCRLIPTCLWKSNFLKIVKPRIEELEKAQTEFKGCGLSEGFGFCHYTTMKGAIAKVERQRREKIEWYDNLVKRNINTGSYKRDFEEKEIEKQIKKIYECQPGLCSSCSMKLGMIRGELKGLLESKLKLEEGL